MAEPTNDGAGCSAATFARNADGAAFAAHNARLDAATLAELRCRYPDLAAAADQRRAEQDYNEHLAQALAGQRAKYEKRG